jgi:hypothetical protein
MAIDEELLKPTREHIARLGAEIEKHYVNAMETAKMRPHDRHHERAVWERFYAAIRPLEREREAHVRILADYYALQPMPPQIVAKTTMEHIARDIRDGIFPKRSWPMREK